MQIDKSQILELLSGIARDLGMGIILVTHDLGVVAQTCDRVVVMYGGSVAEENDVASVFARPQHPYTQQLLQSFPDLAHPDRALRGIPGLTLVELMVALAIGSFLVIGAVQIYNQSRQAYIVNESIARVQETAQFALDTIEADLRMASTMRAVTSRMSALG